MTPTALSRDGKAMGIMTEIKVGDLRPTGLPLYQLRQMFHATGDFEDVTFSLSSRLSLVPAYPLREQDATMRTSTLIFLTERSTRSAERTLVWWARGRTLIPRGEYHWCENRSDRPCTLICMMVK